MGSFPTEEETQRRLKEEAMKKMTPDEKKVAEEVAEKVKHPYVVMLEISESLKRIANALENAVVDKEKPKFSGPLPKKSVPQQTLTPAPAKTTSSDTDKRVKEVKKYLEEYLDVLDIIPDESSNFIKVKPKKFLGADLFHKIANKVKETGGMYLSQGRESHFRYAKTSERLKPKPKPQTETPKAQPSTGMTVEKVKMLFPKDLEEMLVFTEDEKSIIIKPRQYLGSENFAKIAAIVRDSKGEYVSAGKNSHFRVPK